jgi:hypothetical protein
VQLQQQQGFLQEVPAAPAAAVPAAALAAAPVLGLVHCHCWLPLEVVQLFLLLLVPELLLLGVSLWGRVWNI